MHTNYCIVHAVYTHIMIVHDILIHVHCPKITNLITKTLFGFLIVQLYRPFIVRSLLIDFMIVIR